MRLTEDEARWLADWQQAEGGPRPSLPGIVERILTARSADAWDEGYQADAVTSNPYRALLDAAPAGGAEWVSGVCESDDGPREATSHCVLPRDHAGDHCDDTGGSWHR